MDLDTASQLTATLDAAIRKSRARSASISAT
jgi:hypothetical protein